MGTPPIWVIICLLIFDSNIDNGFFVRGKFRYKAIVGNYRNKKGKIPKDGYIYGQCIVLAVFRKRIENLSAPSEQLLPADDQVVGSKINNGLAAGDNRTVIISLVFYNDKCVGIDVDMILIEVVCTTIF